MQVERDARFAATEQLFRRVHAALVPGHPVPEQIDVAFKAFANANSFIRKRNGRLEIRLTDLLLDAPDPVLEALAQILISKLYRQPVPRAASHRYRTHLQREDVRARLTLVRRTRGRKESRPPRGEHYDLIELFEAINLRYFGGLMARPDLGWSLRVSRTHLGHYDPGKHVIILSRALDSAAVPRLAVEFVMYHEMLHLRFPVTHRAGRRRVHPPEFKAEERRFEGMAEALQHLKRLALSDSDLFGS